MAAKVFSLLCIGLAFFSMPGAISGTRDDVIKRLSELIEMEQHKKSEPYSSPMQSGQIEGIYNAHIRFNFRGKCKESLMRELLKMPDVQPFISGIVGILILDAYRFGNAPKPSKAQIERIVKMYSLYHDRNPVYDTSLMVYIMQAYDEDLKLWYSNPGQYFSNLQLVEKMNFPKNSVQKILFGEVPVPYNLEAYFQIDKLPEADLLAPDFDTTYINLNFGSVLYTVKDEYSEAWGLWNDDNTNITSAFDASKRVAYRPFSDDPWESLIDSRVYYFMREFLDDAKEKGRDLAILTVWALGNDETVDEYDKKNRMPWNIQGVGMPVLANSLSGIVSLLTSGLVQPEDIAQDQDFMHVFESSGSLLVYILRHNITDRPDLALPYYTSFFQFYFFVAKGLMYMENARLKDGGLPLPILDEYYRELGLVMRGEVTDRIMMERTVDEMGKIFFDQYLGNADLSYYDRPIKRAEDRVYTTAMAAVSLLYTWTVHDQDTGLRWIQATPDLVKETVFGCARWLEEHALSGQYSISNVFFTLDVKSFETLPFWYPANYFKYLNGTELEDFSYIPSEPHVLGMQGYVEPSEYEKMLKIQQFGVPTPLTFDGYNNGTGNMQFWSSDAMTYVGTMFALSMVDALEG